MNKSSNLDGIEQVAKQYSELKVKNKKDGQLQELAIKIIDHLSSPDFSFPLENKSASSSGTVTYLYKNNSSYPEFFNFLSELLHVKVPIEIGAVKFGPGEILVSKDSEQEAEKEMAESIRELKMLVHAKKSNASTQDDATDAA